VCGVRRPTRPCPAQILLVSPRRACRRALRVSPRLIAATVPCPGARTRHPSTLTRPAKPRFLVRQPPGAGIAENAAVFIHSVQTILDERPDEVGALTFDKDDPQALDFVTAASNLRASIFHIPMQSRWDVKEIAGNIIPAIATTNAIIAGGIVLEALKVLAGRSEKCKCVEAAAPEGRTVSLHAAPRASAPYPIPDPRPITNSAAWRVWQVLCVQSQPLR
jgi:hypothetical protein